MAQRALEIQDEAPHDPLFPAAARIPSTFTTALDTVCTLAPHTRTNKANILKVRLTETFLRIAESLRNTRGSLLR